MTRDATPPAWLDPEPIFDPIPPRHAVDERETVQLRDLTHCRRCGYPRRYSICPFCGRNHGKEDELDDLSMQRG